MKEHEQKKDERKNESATGKYIFDRQAGKLVKVSDRASASRKSGADSPPSCGAGGCCGYG
jgi:hypothetical protein